jgi:hypothetical protein
MGTKNAPGEFDCYAKAELDEPMFVLLARDPLAPILVQLWASLQRTKMGWDSGKVAEAESVAIDMIEWRLQP